MNAPTAAAPAAHAAPATTRTRLAWPDVAKGVCILLVVLHHLVGKQLDLVVPANLTGVAAAWEAICAWLKPIRMPLFFAISGFFAASALRRPWAEVARRVISPYYLYVVWLGVFAVIYTFETQMEANRTTSIADLAGELVFAATSMWFLFALALYFALAKLLVNAPPAAVVAVAGLVAASTSWLPLHETNRVSVLTHFVYFFIGAAYPQVIRRLGEARLPIRSLLGAYAVATAALLRLDAPRSITIVALSVIGIPLGIAVAVRLSETSVADRLAWLGQRTLRVYVLHLAVLALLFHLPVRVAYGPTPVAAVLVAIYPIVGALLIAAICLAVHHCLVKVGAGWLFTAPAALMPGGRKVREPRVSAAAPSLDVRLLALSVR